MKIAILLLIATSIIGCSPKIIQTTKTVEKDSTHIDTVKIKKIVKTKGDSIGIAFKLKDLGPTSTGKIVYPESQVKEPKEELSFPAEDPIVFKKTEKQGRLTESVTISKKGNVVITCKEDSLKEIIEQQRITIRKFKDVITTNTDTKEVKFIPKFYKFTFWFFWILVAILLGGTIYKFRKFIPYLSWIP